MPKLYLITALVLLLSTSACAAIQRRLESAGFNESPTFESEPSYRDKTFNGITVHEGRWNEAVASLRMQAELDLGCGSIEYTLVERTAKEPTKLMAECLCDKHKGDSSDGPKRPSTQGVISGARPETGCGHKALYWRPLQRGLVFRKAGGVWLLVSAR